MGLITKLDAEIATISAQMNAFNSFITNYNPNIDKDHEKEQLEQIARIVAAAVGVIAGLVSQNEKDQDPSGAYSKGKGAGTAVGSALTGAAGGAGCLGAVISKNMTAIIVGVSVGVGCFAFGCIASTLFLNYMANKTDGKAQACQDSIVIHNLYDRAKSYSEFLNQYIKIINSVSPAPDILRFRREATLCLQQYQNLPEMHFNNDVFHRIISIFNKHLNDDHPIHQSLKDTNLLSKELFTKQARLIGENLPAMEEEDLVEVNSGLEQEGEELQALNPGIDGIQMEVIDSHKKYLDALRTTHSLVTEFYNLDQDREIKFVEEYDRHPHLFQGSSIRRFTHKGLMINP